MASTVFEHAASNGSWGNWTNFTQYVPSARDLLWPARIVSEAMDSVGLRLGQRIIPEATGAAGGIVDAATTAAAGVGEAAQNLPAGAEILLEVDEASGLASRFSMEGARSLGSVFSYATSKWALCCIIMAVILNRTHIYASTRRNLSLPWKVRLALRIVPIILLSMQARWLLQSIQCQTSPDFAMLRWGNATKSSELLFTQNGGYLHSISSTLLFGATDAQSCVAVQMVQPLEEDDSDEVGDGEGIADLTGSLSLLWPLFKTFSLSQFVETISCAVQGRQLAAETGMTLFEHSLAFAEAENAIGSQLGWGSFGTKTITRKKSDPDSPGESTQIAITRSMIMRRVNTAPEVLLVGFLSSMNHITSHILGIFNLQGRLRLINTGFWGLSFMSVIVWSIWTFSIDDIMDQSLLRFPTVCIIGFIPHMLVFCGIIACSAIYGAALILTALAPPRNSNEALDDQVNLHSSFWQRIMDAHHNMQANVPLSAIRITMHMDFYTALLKTGFSIMTMASEAVYLTENRSINIKERTWLEEERLREIDEAGAHWLGPTFRAQDADLQYRDGIANSVGLVVAKDQPMDLLRKSSSGYAREMTAKKASKNKSHERGMRDGVGATERSGRWIMALEFFLGIGRLVLSWWASLSLKLLAKIGLQTRPRFLLWLISRPKAAGSKDSRSNSSDPDSLPFWLLSINGELKDENVDVEAEMKRRLINEQGHWDETLEKQLDTNTYDWFLAGGWWGNDDSSGTFAPGEREIEDDLTSIISYATTTDESAWESDEENNDGRRTPTQRQPQFSRESTPAVDNPMSSADLAQLLHPRSPEQRAEAQALAAHLTSDKIMTRSQFRQLQLRERARVLISTRHRPTNFVASSPDGKLTAEEETQILEHLIITRRTFHDEAHSSGQNTTWAKGASGMGEGGPQCVVCQSSPRSIIVWPCRCLSLCDDCRVTLAMNNFDKCVCCRRDVASFSRIFVP
ncbi:putative ASI3 [Coleophoma crateriformis]|uniref:Putative ASI3 n=1 Tax=Coleophoma crateriformis TaxID=565419 RepID=A0A3D8S3K6_9HELO|nr:putative ASI3 [Coleophoma crateriformis]